MGWNEYHTRSGVLLVLEILLGQLESHPWVLNGVMLLTGCSSKPGARCLMFDVSGLSLLCLRFAKIEAVARITNSPRLALSNVFLVEFHLKKETRNKDLLKSFVNREISLTRSKTTRGHRSAPSPRQMPMPYHNAYRHIKKKKRKQGEALIIQSQTTVCQRHSMANSSSTSAQIHKYRWK